jgi:hypothetical protein
MGVCFVAYAVSDANIAQCIADPPLIWQVVEHEDESAYLQELENGAKVSVLARFFGKAKPTPEARTLEFSEAELQEVDLDKSWDGLRACLQEVLPEAPAFFEGSGQVGKIEVGYGPALYHQAETIRRIAQAYGHVSEEQLLSTYRGLDLTALYPKGLWKRKDEESESYLTENFLALKEFLKHAEGHSLGVVIRLT